MHRFLRTTLAAAALGTMALAQPAQATLTITAAGATLGFSLASVVTGFPFNGLGPIGITVTPQNTILANSVADQTNRVFANVNNQSFGAALFTASGMGCCAAYATSNGWAWGGQGGHLVRFNSDGTIAQNYNAIGVNNGVWTNPVNGHLLVAYGGIYDVNVSNIAAPVSAIIPGTSQGDGLTVSPDGTIVYTSSITGYRIADGAVVFSTFVSGADGMGIIQSSNALNGNLIVNTVFGNVVMVDVHTLVQTVIADNGARGDYTTNDPNGTLLLTQGDSIMRLSCGQGCGIGNVAPPPTGVPEPMALSLLLAGVGGLGLLRRRAA